MNYNRVLVCAKRVTRIATYFSRRFKERSFHLSRSRLDWKPLLAPLVDASGHTHHICVTHRLESLGRQKGTPPRGTCYNDAVMPLRREFWFSIGCCRVSIPFKHTSRSKHCPWNTAIFPFIWFSKNDRSEIDAIISFVRTQLDEMTFQAMWAEGRELTLEQAVALALDEKDTRLQAAFKTTAP